MGMYFSDLQNLLTKNLLTLIPMTILTLYLDSCTIFSQCSSAIGCLDNMVCGIDRLTAIFGWGLGLGWCHL